MMKRMPLTRTRNVCCESRRAIFALCAFYTALLVLAPSVAPAADETTDKIAITRDAMGKWVETERIISQEKRDLALAKQMLNERIELVQREIDALRGKIDEAQKSIDEADLKRGELLDENDNLKKASDALIDTLGMMETRTTQLLQRLPDPIRERVKPLSQRIPAESEETKLSPSERFQNVVGVLNEVDKFNREIAVVSELRTLPDGSSAEVTALYLGVAQAFYVGATGNVAGIGVPSESGWTWKAANEASPRISQAIAILKNEQAASFVLLPVEIHETK